MSWYSQLQCIGCSTLQLLQRSLQGNRKTSPEIYGPVSIVDGNTMISHACNSIVSAGYARNNKIRCAILKKQRIKDRKIVSCRSIKLTDSGGLDEEYMMFTVTKSHKTKPLLVTVTINGKSFNGGYRSFSVHNQQGHSQRGQAPSLV